VPRAVCVGPVPQKTALFDHHGVQCFESVYIIFDNCIGIRGIECQGAVNQKYLMRGEEKLNAKKDTKEHECQPNLQAPVLYSRILRTPDKTQPGELN